VKGTLFMVTLVEWKKERDNKNIEEKPPSGGCPISERFHKSLGQGGKNCLLKFWGGGGRQHLSGLPDGGTYGQAPQTRATIGRSRYPGERSGCRHTINGFCGNVDNVKQENLRQAWWGYERKKLNNKGVTQASEKNYKGLYEIHGCKTILKNNGGGLDGNR